jgi:hypothetical protein
MHWVAPSEKDLATDTLEKSLWAAADQFRANSRLTAQQYSGPILIFLRFAEASITPSFRPIYQLHLQIRNRRGPDYRLLSGQVELALANGNAQEL